MNNREAIAQAENEDYYFPDSSIKVSEVQAVILELMDEFHRICLQHGLKYSLYCGTMLGAVRHKGFIPWDDDADVVMPREDYKKFLSLAKTEVRDPYFLSNHYTEKNSSLLFSKLRKNGTQMVEPGQLQETIHHGIFLDIFPLDPIDIHSFFGKMQVKFAHFMFLWVSSWSKSRCLATQGIARFSRLFLHYLGHLLGKKILFSWAEQSLQCRRTHTQKNIANLTCGLTSETVGNFSFLLSDFDHLQSVSFAGHSFLMFSDADALLQKQYGDYLQLPPPEKRHPAHCGGDIKLR